MSVTITYSREVIKVGSINYVRKIFGSIFEAVPLFAYITFVVPTFF